MAKYKLLAPHYLGGQIHPEGAIVDYNDDLSKGGHRAGSKMVPCDADGNEIKPKARRADKSAKPDVDDIG